MAAAPAVTDARALETARPRRFADNATLGMALFVFTEAMLFTGFISAFMIVEAGAPPGTWPPPGQPRLPFERTAANTLALLASGVLLYVAGRKLKRHGPAAAERWMWLALLLGAAFVALQGAEWVALLRHGLTLTSSQLGSFFYLIIGTHALHAVAAIVALTFTWLAVRSGRLPKSKLAAVRLFWYFVVLVWPALYLVVYR